MGSLVSIIMCDVKTEEVEERAMETAPTSPSHHYVDDTHTQLDAEHAQDFTDQLNTLDPNIKFTTEEEGEDGLAFLDTNAVSQST